MASLHLHQFAGDHDPNSRAQGICLLHGMRGQDGSLVATETGNDGVPGKQQMFKCGNARCFQEGNSILMGTQVASLGMVDVSGRKPDFKWKWWWLH